MVQYFTHTCTYSQPNIQHTTIYQLNEGRACERKRVRATHLLVQPARVRSEEFEIFPTFRSNRMRACGRSKPVSWKSQPPELSSNTQARLTTSKIRSRRGSQTEAGNKYVCTPSIWSVVTYHFSFPDYICIYNIFTSIQAITSLPLALTC